jgi:hypothetical protein
MKTVSCICNLIILFTLCSCTQSPDLNFEENRDAYRKAVACLDSSYASVFSSNGSNSETIYNSERVSDRNRCCEDLLRLLEKQSVSMVTYDKDSTVAFYSRTIGGIKSRQRILLFTRKASNLKEKLSFDKKLISEKGGGWYELERILTLAN